MDEETLTTLLAIEQTTNDMLQELLRKLNVFECKLDNIGNKLDSFGHKLDKYERDSE